VVDNPYANETATNTDSTAWLDGYHSIKADFGSLSQYAMNMMNAATFLMPTAASLHSIPQYSMDAFSGLGGTDGDTNPDALSVSPFPEGRLVHQVVSTNYHDLTAFVMELQTGLRNVAFAAQTISDAYHLNDTRSAHDINSLVTADGVDFAFGKGGQRPKGLDNRIGKTWFDALLDGSIGAGQDQASANAGALLAANDPNSLGGTVDTSYLSMGAGSLTTTTVTYPDGSQSRISTFVDSGGKKSTEYQTLNAKGVVTSAVRKYESDTGGTHTVVTQTQDDKGNFQPSRTETTSTSSYVDPDAGKVSTTTTVSTGADGTKTTVETTHDAYGTRTTTTTAHPGKAPTTTTVAVGSNDSDTSDQVGDADPLARANKHYLPSKTAPSTR